MTGQGIEVVAQVIGCNDGNMASDKTRLQLVYDVLGILEFTATHMPDWNGLGCGIDRCPNEMTTGGTFDVSNQLIELDVAKGEIAKETVMDSQRLLSHIRLRAATIEHLEGASNIIRVLLEIGHGRVMSFADIGATGLADPLADSLSTVPTI